MKKLPGAMLAGTVLVLLILDSQAAVEGARVGLELCLQAVVPSLFPFLVLTAYLTGNLPDAGIPWVERLCRIPGGSGGIFLTGLLGGYPTGTAAIVQAYKSGRLTQNQAHRMLGFCSNAGPAFLFGMLSPLFPHPICLWTLWAVHILSAIITAMVLPGEAGPSIGRTNVKPISFPQCVVRSVDTMGKICGWVILFRVALQLADWWFRHLTQPIRVFLWGLTELTNGCAALEALENSGLRFVLAAVFLGFGGLCVGMQTLSITGELGTGLYFPGKALQACVSALLAFLAQPVLFGDNALPIWPVLIPTAVICAAFWKNSSSIFRPQPV